MDNSICAEQNPADFKQAGRPRVACSGRKLSTRQLKKAGNPCQIGPGKVLDNSICAEQNPAGSKQAARPHVASGCEKLRRS